MANQTPRRRDTQGLKNGSGTPKSSKATTRSTGGPGYNFEDLVAAHLLVKMLLGRQLPGVGGDGCTLQFQTEPLGWKIDDLLVAATDGSSSRHFAVSCKSNHQVTGKGLPSNFVSAAWEQWRAADVGPINRSSDALALVTRGQPNAFPATWADIVQWCNAGDDKAAIKRIRASNKHASIFESIRKPDGNAVATDQETVELIQHLAVIPLDFQLEPSKDRENAIEWCRQLVASGSRSDAETIWNELVRLASDSRIVGGTIRLSEIWAQLRKRFRLKAQPDFAASWESLASVTREHRQAINTALPSGHIVPRERMRKALAEHLEQHAFTLVIGESGCGKSALVKQLLDDQGAQQVWFGPDQIAAATSDLERSKLQLAYPLEDILLAAPTAANVLVIDAAEKLSGAVISRLRVLLDELIPPEADAPDGAWRVVITTQREGGGEQALSLLGQRETTPVSVGDLEEEEVRNALLSTKELKWLANDSLAVSALRNLKMLGWAVEAEAVLKLEKSDVTSPPALADRIWGYWTNGRADAQRLLMVLGKKEANFERSFPLTGLSPGDTSAYDREEATLPLRLNDRNRLVFEHDLAADWSRFQWLKQVADDSSEWGPLAQNPLWSSSLRLLGQFLLRDRGPTTSAWDVALAEAEERGDKPTIDILLDALCLDPNALEFLNERAALIFADDGALLKRLLRRFLHIATVPQFSTHALDVDAQLGLYFEANHRTPIVGRWPVMALFFHRHIEAITQLASPVVSKVCETWLAATPRDLGEAGAMPLRREFAEVALANVRTAQIQKATGTLYLGDGWEPLYSAALAGAADLPEVAEWLLEEAERRPLSGEIADRIADIEQRKTEEREERLRNDPNFTARDRERTQKMASMPSILSASRELSPWPHGPQDRIDSGFRKVAIEATALVPLMRANPQLAAEVLLALLIEGKPKEDRYQSPLDDHLGLEFDHSSYPTAFWKSPFFQFLHIAPDLALSTIIKLVDFCTERWVAGRAVGGESQPPDVRLRMPEGEKRFIGDGRVFDWTETDSTGQGQLFCALNALERWLTQEIEAGGVVEPHLTKLLQESTSVAVLGLLTNIAKYQPSLLEGVLRPLLSGEEVYHYDSDRIQNRRFPSMVWVRDGEAIYNFAQEWAFSPHRKRGFLELAVQLVKREPTASSFVQSAIEGWPKHDHPKDVIEAGIIIAALNPENYRKRTDATTGQEIEELVYPPELSRKIEAFQSENAPKLRNIMLPHQLEEILKQSQPVASEDAVQLATLLSELPSDGENARSLRTAIAATLVGRSGEWLSDHAQTNDRVRSILREVAAGAACTHDGVRSVSIGLKHDDLKFAAYGVMHLWITEGHSGEWDEPLLSLLTSGHPAVPRVVGALGHQNRTALGGRWWQLLQTGLLWSALSMLAPAFGDDELSGVRWTRWLHWLRSRALKEEVADASSIDPAAIWERVRKIENGRWRKRLTNTPSWSVSTECRSTGLQTDFLDGLFAWLLGDEEYSIASFDDDQRDMLLRFWEYERRWCAHARNDRDEYHLPYQFGYHILEKLAWIAATDPTEEASTAWREVIQLGSDARVLIEPFISSFLLYRDQNPELFVERWKAMIAFALASKWTTGRRWFDEQKMLRHLLGFGVEELLQSIPNKNTTIVEMGALYEQWAKAHVVVEEENIAAFANFLTTELGAPLRINGLKWLSASVETASRKIRWGENAAGDAMIRLLDAALMTNAAELSRDTDARTALVKLAAELASRQVSSALALQERIRGTL